MRNKLSILVLDDDKNFRRVLIVRLKNIFPDAKFTEFESLDEVRQFFKNNSNAKFDLALLDQHLPDGKSGDLLDEGTLGEIPVLAMSSDDSPELPAGTLRQGARFFIPKAQTSQSIFPPLVTAIIERSQFEKQAKDAAKSREVLEAIKTMINTLQHEINNPLGAVFGATYLLKSDISSSGDKEKAMALIDQSSKRIKTVLDNICKAAELEAITKGAESLFHVPGDPEWKLSKEEKK
ncbi:MAG TPA: histidine kinase dimerization/phospho-acceptor domain-containing protein [Oligoflexia bacterium]|nr:histidine kinase dimerization/phospho-acceptor domain-containing protein [Oligoflexia bacterium]HMP48448.1 histidine kinase dimerization/phospho-acceptor domain-containing protein [Oligoflexia bacterium]